MDDYVVVVLPAKGRAFILGNGPKNSSMTKAKATTLMNDCAGYLTMISAEFAVVSHRELVSRFGVRVVASLLSDVDSRGKDAQAGVREEAVYNKKLQEEAE